MIPLLEMFMKKREPKALTCPETCSALCCKYIVKHLEPPRTKLDFDEFYWFLCHEKVAIFIDQRKWYLLVDVPCEQLDEKLLCRIYPKRPHVCRLHSEKDCEFTGDVEFQEIMRLPEDLIKHMKRRGISFRVPWMDGNVAGRKGGRGRSTAKKKGKGKKGKAKG